MLNFSHIFWLSILSCCFTIVFTPATQAQFNVDDKIVRTSVDECDEQVYRAKCVTNIPEGATELRIYLDKIVWLNGDEFIKTIEFSGAEKTNIFRFYKYHNHIRRTDGSLIPVVWVDYY
jgi:hypothetical protein